MLPLCRAMLPASSKLPSTPKLQISIFRHRFMDHIPHLHAASKRPSMGTFRHLETEILTWRLPGGTHLSNLFLPLLQQPSQSPHADAAPKHPQIAFCDHFRCLENEVSTGGSPGDVHHAPSASLHSRCPTSVPSLPNSSFPHRFITVTFADSPRRRYYLSTRVATLRPRENEISSWRPPWGVLVLSI